MKTFRSKEDRIAEIEKKVKFHQDTIVKLEAKKTAILNAKPRSNKKSTTKSLLESIKSGEITLEEAIAKLA